MNFFHHVQPPKILVSLSITIMTDIKSYLLTVYVLFVANIRRYHEHLTSIRGQVIVVSFSFNRAAQIIVEILRKGQNPF